MNIAQNLVETGVIEADALQGALQRQQDKHEPLCESLLRNHAISFAQLDAYLGYQMPVIRSIADTGLSRSFLLNLMAKIMFVNGLDTVAAISDAIKLPYAVVEELVDLARERSLVEALGAAGSHLVTEFRYGLSAAGRELATRALQQTEYAGPAPVPLEMFRKQIEAQAIIKDRVSRERLAQALEHLVLDKRMIDMFGPGINSGQALLIYGPVGNGKTSLALALAQSFENYVYIPHAIEVDGQIINVYDPTVHHKLPDPEIDLPAQDDHKTILRSAEDRRWVRCRRPVAIAGGELNLEMLDLKFDPQLRFCEAPLQLKALSGVFIIDDFGRQSVRPEDILNRWVYPLERGVDFLTLPTGKKFAVPFDSMFIISTNQSPSELVDAAMLRRIPYKYHILPPGIEEYRKIFKMTAEQHGLEYDDAWTDLLIHDFYDRFEVPIARFHPAFLLQQISARWRFEEGPPVVTRENLIEAAQHLVVRE